MIGKYVLATDPGDVEQRRMALLFAYHGQLTIEVLESAGVSHGWRCLEVGAGGGDITRWLAKMVTPGGSVVAIDLETRWIEALASDVVDVRRGDFGTLDLAPASFDLIVAQMLLLHLPNPADASRRFIELCRPAGQIVIQDTDFTTLALNNASASEAAGLSVMPDVMRAAGVDLSRAKACRSTRRCRREDRAGGDPTMQWPRRGAHRRRDHRDHNRAVSRSH